MWSTTEKGSDRVNSILSLFGCGTGHFQEELLTTFQVKFVDQNNKRMMKLRRDLLL